MLLKNIELYFMMIQIILVISSGPFYLWLSSKYTRQQEQNLECWAVERTSGNKFNLKMKTRKYPLMCRSSNNKKHLM